MTTTQFDHKATPLTDALHGSDDAYYHPMRMHAEKLERALRYAAWEIRSLRKTMKLSGMSEQEIVDKLIKEANQ